MTTAARPRVLVLVDLGPEPDCLAPLHAVAQVDYHPGDHTRLQGDLSGYDALWCHFSQKIDAGVLSRAPRLKTVNTATTGTDHIDKTYCAAHGIRVLCTALDIGLLEHFSATAECAWMLLLACHRNLRGAVAHVERGQWGHKPFIGRQLMGRTMGVLGVGRLGKMSVRMAQGFAMNVIACDRQPITLPGVRQVDFDTLLREADALTLHIHMTQDNYHLFNAATFAKMKRGMIMVNTSRGDLVDEAALLTALEDGTLAAYGADVIHNEWQPDLLQSPLVRYAVDHPNVVITPHLGGATHESMSLSRQFSARKLAQWLSTGTELCWPTGAPRPWRE